MHAKLTPAASLIWAVEATLGEGPVWVPTDSRLWFVDIEGQRLHRYDPTSEERTSFAIDGRPSFVVRAEGGGLLLGVERQLLRFRNGRVTDVVATLPAGRDVRTNDAVVDPSGRLWFGTMDNSKAEPHGQIFRFDGKLRAMGGACAITNGPAVSPDGRILYHVDTVGRRVWAFGIGEGDAPLKDGEVFTDISPSDGHPDGITVDSRPRDREAVQNGHLKIQRQSPSNLCPAVRV